MTKLLSHNERKTKQFKGAIETLDKLIDLETRKLATMNKLRIALTQEMAKHSLKG